jgi:cytochrome d ubiquinol oxidase subunit I
MDAVFLARLQFALTVGFHFIFPSISLGLAWLLVVVEWFAWRTKDAIWVSAGKFFGGLFALTFALGVATGVVMEFQFGTNWASYSRFVGDIFGAPLAAEAIFAFFLESSFLGLYLFGRRRVSPGIHWFSILMVAIGATISAFWIIVANSWQQTPAGYALHPMTGRPELTSFAEAVFNPSTLPRSLHTVFASLVTASFFMAGVSALLLLRKRARVVAERTLALAVIVGFVTALLVAFPFGHKHAQQVAATQPEKFAAIEGLYTGYRSGAPLVLFAFPVTPPPELKARIEVPNLLSWLAFGDVNSPVKGLNEFPADRVPRGAELWLSFVSFHNMVILGTYFIAVLGLALFYLWRRRLATKRWLLWALVVSTPLPVAACQLGWVTAEVGRQPWIVYGLLRTENAVSRTVSGEEVLFSIVIFGVIYLLLGALWIFLLNKKVQAGPEALETASEVL